MKLCFIILLLCTCFFGYGDTPGKPKNHPCNVTLQRVSALSDYSLHWQKKYAGDTFSISKDTTIAVPGSSGAPDEGYLWGIHKKTGKSTDTVTFSNYYSSDKVMTITGITGDKIQYTIQSLSNDNQRVTTVNEDSINDKSLLEPARRSERKHNLRITLLVSLGVLAIAGLLIFFLYRRKKTTAKTAQGTGS